MSHIHLGNPGVDPDGAVSGCAYLMMWAILIPIYVFCWWVFNYLVGNPSPTLWDFVWQTIIVIGVLNAPIANIR